MSRNGSYSLKFAHSKGGRRGSSKWRKTKGRVLVSNRIETKDLRKQIISDTYKVSNWKRARVLSRLADRRPLYVPSPARRYYRLRESFKIQTARPYTLNRKDAPFTDSADLDAFNDGAFKLIQLVRVPIVSPGPRFMSLKVKSFSFNVRAMLQTSVGNVGSFAVFTVIRFAGSGKKPYVSKLILGSMDASGSLFTTANNGIYIKKKFRKKGKKIRFYDPESTTEMGEPRPLYGTLHLYAVLNIFQKKAPKQATKPKPFTKAADITKVIQDTRPRLVGKKRKSEALGDTSINSVDAGGNNNNSNNSNNNNNNNTANTTTERQEITEDSSAKAESKSGTGTTEHAIAVGPNTPVLFTIRGMSTYSLSLTT